VKFNYIIYETSIKESIPHSLKEISEVIRKPDLKYLTYRGQHKNGTTSIEDISYTGSGTSLDNIRKYFCGRDRTEYSSKDIFSTKILEQGYKTQGEINMSETQAIVGQVEDGENINDVTLNGNKGPGPNGTAVNEQENEQVEALYGYHDDEKTVPIGGDEHQKYGGEFSQKHHHQGYCIEWWRAQLRLIRQQNTQFTSAADVEIAMIEHYINNPPKELTGTKRVSYSPTTNIHSKDNAENNRLIARSLLDVVGKLIK